MSRTPMNRLERSAYACLAVGVLPMAGLIVTECVEAVAMAWGYRLTITPPPILELPFRYWITSTFWMVLCFGIGTTMFVAAQRASAARLQRAERSRVERFKDLCPTRLERAAAVGTMLGLLALLVLSAIGVIQLLGVVWDRPLWIDSDTLFARALVTSVFWSVAWLLLGFVGLKRSHRLEEARHGNPARSAPEMSASA